jgi:hypothetical protein
MESAGDDLASAAREMYDRWLFWPDIKVIVTPVV